MMQTLNYLSHFLWGCTFEVILWQLLCCSDCVHVILYSIMLATPDVECVTTTCILLWVHCT